MIRDMLTAADQRAMQYYYYGEGKPPKSSEGYFQCLIASQNDWHPPKPCQSSNLEDGYLPVSAALAIYRAVCFANSRGIILNGMYTINWNKMGIDHEDDIHQETKNVMESFRKFINRNGGVHAAMYVQEKSRDNGRHTHILCHLPEKIGGNSDIPYQFLYLIDNKYRKYSSSSGVKTNCSDTLIDLRRNELRFFPLKKGGFYDESYIYHKSTNFAVIGQMQEASYLMKQIYPRARVPAIGRGKKSLLKARKVLFKPGFKHSPYEPFLCNRRYYICEELSARFMSSCGFRSNFEGVTG